MGIFDRIKGEAQRSFIARPPGAKDDLVYLHPENNVRLLTQLTVGADEVALFVKDGKVEGTLGPAGSPYTLETRNVPFLSRLLEGFTGGNLFVAQVFFVTTREVPGIKFGGPVGDMRDPETGLGIGTRVYGDFSVRVTQPERLVTGLVGLRGTSNEELLGWFKNQVLKVTRDRLAEMLVKKGTPLLALTSGAYTEELEADILAGLAPHVDAYGLSVVRLGNFHVSIKEEDEATLKKLSKDVAYSRLAGGFQQYAQGQAMLGAAEGMARGGGEGAGGGAALQGMGLGVGLGMAGQLVNPQQARPAGGAAAGAPAPVNAGGFCPHCGAAAQGGRFCSGCGKPLAPAPAACAGCGTQLAPGARFCSGCGKPLA